MHPDPPLGPAEREMMLPLFNLEGTHRCSGHRDAPHVRKPRRKRLLDGEPPAYTQLTLCVASGSVSQFPTVLTWGCWAWPRGMRNWRWLRSLGLF